MRANTLMSATWTGCAVGSRCCRMLGLTRHAGSVVLISRGLPGWLAVAVESCCDARLAAESTRSVHRTSGGAGPGAAVGTGRRGHGIDPSTRGRGPAGRSAAASAARIGERAHDANLGTHSPVGAALRGVCGSRRGPKGPGVGASSTWTGRWSPGMQLRPDEGPGARRDLRMAEF